MDNQNFKLISKGKNKAQIIVHELVDVVHNGEKVGTQKTHQTLHLLFKGGRWRDKSGQEWAID